MGTDAPGAALRRASVVETGSVTKVFVAALVSTLAEDGVLALDDAFASHVPGLLSDGGEITLRSLLNHTSGLSDFFDDLEFRTAWLADRSHEPPAAELVRVAERLPRRERGAFSYANVNYVSLGLTVEAATGETVAEALRTRVLEPLGLVDAYLPSTPMAVSGGLHATVAEVARFLAALMREEVVGGPSLREMLRTVPSPWPESREYGLGIELVDSLTGGERRDTVAWGHIGLGAGTTIALTTRDGVRQIVVWASAMLTDRAAWRALDRLTWAVLADAVD